ncbi:hypothetical protein BX616_004599, partial [Lobosporangium transversale]
MTDPNQQQTPGVYSPLVQNRRQQTSNAYREQQHQNHVQFISSTPLPNPRRLFPDASRAKRTFHPTNSGPTSYGAINDNSMRINTASANAAAMQAGFISPGPTTPKQKQVPLRTTKVSQKLVMLPEDQEDDETGYEENPFDDSLDPFRDEPNYWIKRRGLHGRAPTRSELLTKEQRSARGLARVVAYCTAEGYDIKRLTTFLREKHAVQPRLYDEALYAAYHFPLVPGKTTKYMAGPPVRSPGGGSVLDKQLEQYEENTGDAYSRSLEHAKELAEEGYRQHLKTQGDGIRSGNNSINSKKLKNRRQTASRPNEQNEDVGLSTSRHETGPSDQSTSTALEQQDYFTDTVEDQTTTLKSPTDLQPDTADLALTSSQNHAVAPFMGGEVFFFDYGVTVFWNMTLEQEAWIMDDLAQFEIKRLLPEDVQTEEFHFEYAGYSAPRIYNDMITLRGGNHMIKLTISHAISQSVKLALYECQMDDTIDDTKIIPIQLAQTGKLNYSRPQITRISGHLFQLRMNVDLVSNVLDTPEIFWSEPELQPLYNAIRGYLEIGQRAKVLSDRCLVISDLLTMLRDDLASNNMNYNTWIVIILIVIAVIVAA